ATPYHLRGLANLRLGRLNAALADLDAALARRPTLWEARATRAVVHRRMKRFDAALADLQKARVDGGPECRLWFQEAVVQREAGNRAAAAEAFATGRQTPPVDELCLVARGLARMPDEPTEALADFRQARAMNRECTAALQNMAYVLSAKLRDPKQAVEVMNDYLELQPGDVVGRAGRAVLHGRLGAVDAARADVEFCLAQRPTPGVLFQLAGAFAQCSRFRPADARRAIDLLEVVAHDQSCIPWSDSDLDPIRDHAAFKKLVDDAAARKKARR
ncbi:MAG: tetratricopeptide repeat protein, partial [Planctomycetia bacterium]